MPDLKSAKANKFNNQFIINESNFNDFIVNLDIINNMDYDTDIFWKKEIFLPLLKTVNQKNPLQHREVMTFILSVHNQINRYVESYCTDCYNSSYKNKIVDLAEKTIAYVKTYGFDEIIFQTQFVKGILINIISAYGHIMLYNKDFDKLKNIVKLFDDLNIRLKFNENTPSYEFIYKIKGDYWLFGGFKDIKASLSSYEKVLKLLPDNHPKRPVILFNMGYCHFLNDNKSMAIEYLSRCINEFNVVEMNHINCDFYYRPEAINKKINVARKMVSLLSSN